MACRHSEDSDQPLLFVLHISPDPQSVDAQEDVVRHRRRKKGRGGRRGARPPPII